MKFAVYHVRVLLVHWFWTNRGYQVYDQKKELYKPVTKCTYRPVLGSFNNSNIIKLSQKSTLSETFDEIHQVIIYGISDNMASLVESGKYGAINTTGT